MQPTALTPKQAPASSSASPLSPETSAISSTCRAQSPAKRPPLHPNPSLPRQVRRPRSRIHLRQASTRSIGPGPTPPQETQSQRTAGRVAGVAGGSRKPFGGECRQHFGGRLRTRRRRQKGSIKVSLADESASKRAAMLALKVTGGISWALAYREAVSVASREGAKLLPSSAIAVNAVWEAVYSAGGVATWKKLTVEDKTQTILNITWLLGDVAWMATLRRHDPKHFKDIQRYLPAALAYQLAFLSFYEPGDAARRSALIQNLGFSAYCALKNDRDCGSIRFSLLRAVGTAVPTFTSGVFRGFRPEYAAPGFACIAFDVMRVWRTLGQTKRQ